MHSAIRSEHDAIRRLCEKIENLRYHRRSQWKQHTHPTQKRFTQEELGAMAFPSYRNLLFRRSRRLPSRDTLLEIAVYLECTPAERNDLLMCAGYLPETQPQDTSLYQRALTDGQTVLNRLLMPAMLITPLLEIAATNDAFDRLYNWRTGQERLTNVVGMQFDPRHRLHPIFNPSPALGRKNAASVLGFYFHRTGMTGGAPLPDTFHVYPGFADAWKQTESITSLASVVLTCQDGAFGQHHEIRLLKVSITWASYPCIVVLQPEDRAARWIYKHAGIE